MTLTGDAGFGYALEATTNFNAWSRVASNSAFRGTWQVEIPATESQSFYRAHRLP